MTLILILLACAPLVGDWTGEVDCGDYSMDVEVNLEWLGDGYEGEGKLDCTDYYGSECEQQFDIEVDSTGPFGEQELDVDLDDCEYDLGGFSSPVACDNPDDLEWDGGNTISGEWSSCDVELERE